MISKLIGTLIALGILALAIFLAFSPQSGDPLSDTYVEPDEPDIVQEKLDETEAFYAYPQDLQTSADTFNTIDQTLELLD